MAVQLTYPIDEVQLASIIADGWTHVELFYANAPDGAFATTSVRALLAATTYSYALDWSGGNVAQWGKVALWNGSANSALALSNPFPFGGGTTYSLLRQKVGLLTKDMVTGTTTSAGGTTTANCASIGVTRFDDDHFNNWYFHRTSGTQEWTQVTDYAKAGGVLTLAPAIASVDSGVTFELTARWTPTDYREAINWAIVTAYPTLNRTIINRSLRTITDVFEYRLPMDIRNLSKVEIETDSDLATSAAARGQPWREIPYSLLTDGLTKSIEFKRELAAGRRLRITGTGVLSLLLNDSDYVELLEPQVSLITFLAAAYLYGQLPNDAASSDIDRFQELAQYYFGQFEHYKGTFTSGRAPVKIWSQEAKWGRR